MLGWKRKIVQGLKADNHEKHLFEREDATLLDTYLDDMIKSNTKPASEVKKIRNIIIHDTSLQSPEVANFNSGL